MLDHVRDGYEARIQQLEHDLEEEKRKAPDPDDLAEAEAEIADLRKRLDAAEKDARFWQKRCELAVERTQNVLLYCGNTLELLRYDKAIENDVERKTDGTDS